MPSSSFYIPSVDITPYLEDPHSEAGAEVVEQVRAACVSTGFFQLLGHGVPLDIQKDAFQASARFFNLPMESKLKYKTSLASGWKGYEQLEAQSYAKSKDAKGDLKEGFILSKDLPEGHPLRGVEGRLLTSVNRWPTDVLSDDEFRKPVERYNDALTKLVGTVMKLIAATLPYGPNVFDGINEEAAFPLRFLHYPPMPKNTDTTKQQGAGAHTDFSLITLLLQDEHAGLEVYDYEAHEWVLVPPNPDAYVVNLGDMMSKLLNRRYKSSLHRVISRDPADRYSIVFFHDGNREYELKPLGVPASEQVDKDLTCEEYMFDRIKWSFGRHNKHDLTTAAA